MIRPTDHVILRAFLRREADMYWWKKDGGEKRRRQSFIDRMFKTIVSKYPEEAFDYIHIQSISNMGFVTSELVLSAQRYKTGRDVYLSLPPSPKGGISFTIKEREI